METLLSLTMLILFTVVVVAVLMGFGVIIYAIFYKDG